MQANVRIPCRPLDAKDIELATAKELIVDYDAGTIKVSKTDGTIVDITSVIKDEVIKVIQKDPDSFFQDIKITIDGIEYNFTTAITKIGDDITKINKEIEAIKKILNVTVDGDGNVIVKFPDTVVQFQSSDSDKLVKNISADSLNETETRKFLTLQEKEQFSKSTHPEIINVVIGTAWEGSSAPYSQKITVADIKESDTPVVDVLLADVYETVQRQLDNYAYIYKIRTYNGYIMVYASSPTEESITVQMKVERQD